MHFKKKKKKKKKNRHPLKSRQKAYDRLNNKGKPLGFPSSSEKDEISPLSSSSSALQNLGRSVWECVIQPVWMLFMFCVSFVRNMSGITKLTLFVMALGFWFWLYISSLLARIMLLESSVAQQHEWTKQCGAAAIQKTNDCASLVALLPDPSLVDNVVDGVVQQLRDVHAMLNSAFLSGEYTSQLHGILVSRLQAIEGDVGSLEAV